ncbi:hypothetical protein ACQP1P_35540 [Dactylosporangium sp. CA-052675]|uniref:hypothetical protein n=1 Tax=Dactylosporangium sp. CA-052675 TaxID=3239927 RepID=UPI003D89EF4F
MHMFIAGWRRCGARRTAVVRLAGALTAAAVALAGCATGPVDGNTLARDAAEWTAKQLNDKFGRRSRVRDAEYIAATEIPAEPQDGGDVRVTPLSWSGRTSGDETATIDIRFAATVPSREPHSFGARGNTAGSATRCYRYELQLYRDTGYHEIRCPQGVTPPVPSASPVLTLPPDADDRLTAALRSATPDTLANVVRAAFPQDGIRVDTVIYQDTMVAAVGVPAERDCLVMIRTPDGMLKQVSYDPIQLEPGETGCNTRLYTNPPR